MKRYELVLMDLDDTLLDFGQAEDNALKRSFAQFGIELTEAARMAYETINAGLWRMLELGRIDQDRLKVERFRLLFLELGLRVDASAFSGAYIEWLSRGVFPLPFAPEICAYLGATYSLAIVTNGIAAVQHPRIRESPFAPFIDAVIVSEEAGSSKPRPGIFAVACDRLGVHDKRAVIMVGDSLESDIRGGIDFGIDTCWLNPDSRVNPTTLRPSYEIRRLEELKAIL